jgi:hypothetical protein
LDSLRKDRQGIRYGRGLPIAEGKIAFHFCNIDFKTADDAFNIESLFGRQDILHRRSDD